jgi:WD40 repeat protein
VALGPDGRQAVSGGEDRTVRVWDVTTGREVRRLAGHANAVVRVAFAPGGSVLSAASRYQTTDRVLRRWDPATGREWPLPADLSFERVECAAFSADGRFALLGTGGGSLRLVPL